MDADTRDLLANSIRALLRRSPGDLVAGLAELGWTDVVSDDEQAAVDLLFVEQGRAGVASAALDTVMLTGDAFDPSVLLVHPLGAARSSVDAGILRVDGVVLAAPTAVATYVVALDGAGVYAVAGDTECVSPIRGFDPDAAMHRVRLDVSLDDATAYPLDWESAVGAGRRALAGELIGNGQAMLELATEQVAQRNQFGRPIGANQTPRHRLADSYVQLAAARELLGVAWASRTPWDALVAKAYAGMAAEITSAACLQVCGAIGLTSEHSLGGYVKRSRVLDALHGGWQHSTLSIGRQLLVTREVPAGVRV